MKGREDKKENDLFFTCSLIGYIAKKTKNKRSAVVDALGQSTIAKIYDLADVYHSDNIERVSDDFIQAAGVTEGVFDNVSVAKFAVPSHWDIGKVCMDKRPKTYYNVYDTRVKRSCVSCLHENT